MIAFWISAEILGVKKVARLMVIFRWHVPYLEVRSKALTDFTHT